MTVTVEEGLTHVYVVQIIIPGQLFDEHNLRALFRVGIVFGEYFEGFKSLVMRIGSSCSGSVYLQVKVHETFGFVTQG